MLITDLIFMIVFQTGILTKFAKYALKFLDKWICYKIIDKQEVSWASPFIL